MKFKMHAAVTLAGCALVTACPIGVTAQSAVDEIAKYRQQLQEGNPAELWEARGEDLWKQKRGPKNVSLERCELGKGAGVGDCIAGFVHGAGGDVGEQLVGAGLAERGFGGGDVFACRIDGGLVSLKAGDGVVL